MKTLFYWVIAIIIVVIILAAIGIHKATNSTMSSNPIITSTTTEADDSGPVKVTPIEHATAILDWAGQVIYTDPVATSSQFDTRPANIVLITHDHPDHFNKDTLLALFSRPDFASTSLVVPPAVADLLPAQLKSRATILANNQVKDVDGFNIQTVPAYNIPESLKTFHPKGRGNGYIIERDGYRVYVAGDTSGTPEMKALQHIDMAFLPMNLPYTMSVDEAATATLALKPKIVYPYHYRGTDGFSDIHRFKQLVNQGDPSIDVRLENWYPNNK